MLMIRTEQAASSIFEIFCNSQSPGVSGLKVGCIWQFDLSALGLEKQSRVWMEGAMGWTFLFVLV